MSAMEERDPDRASMVGEIRTERLLVRPLTEADEAEFLRVHRVSEDEFRPWFPTRTRSLEEAFGSELERSRDTERHVRWVGELDPGRIVGLFNLGEIVRGAFHNAYVSWAVSSDVAGEGYATEAVCAILDLAFSEEEGLGLHRVQANIIPENDRSVRLAERVGMRWEGRAERYLKIAGRWQDHWMYAKTVEEHTFRYLS